MAVTREQILDLTVEERLELLDVIWSTLDDQSAASEITDAFANELDRRYQEHRRDPEASIHWDELRAKLDAQHQ